MARTQKKKKAPNVTVSVKADRGFSISAMSSAPLIARIAGHNNRVGMAIEEKCAKARPLGQTSFPGMPCRPLCWWRDLRAKTSGGAILNASHVASMALSTFMRLVVDSGPLSPKPLSANDLGVIHSFGQRNPKCRFFLNRLRSAWLFLFFFFPELVECLGRAGNVLPLIALEIRAAAR